MKEKLLNLVRTQKYYMQFKEKILLNWVEYDSPKKILELHKIEPKKFIDDYAGGVFDYFMGVISGELEIGNCPTMQDLLVYLKDRDVRADELFEICSNFRRSMIDFTYSSKLNSKELFEELYYLFDKNFNGVLKYYTDTIFQKEQEININVKLLSEYKKALDESALISKTDLNGNITYINENFTNLCGYSEVELIGKNHNIMRHKDTPKEYFDNLWYELKHNNLYKGTIKNSKKNGEYFYIDMTIVEINDVHSKLAEYMLIAYDITKLIDARFEAQKAGQAKEYFLSNMSHEIRTPLNAILGFVKLLIDDDISKKHREYLNIIYSSSKNLLSIINNILDFSKLRSGEFTIEPKVFFLHKEISSSLELFVASASVKNITILSFIDPKIPKQLFGDALRIKQILSNFLSNAIKFTPEGGLINIEVSYINGILKIAVTDNGIGISNDNLKNIFFAFVQAEHQDHAKSEGTGLGLSICNQLAKHMHGFVNVASELGKGSTFWMEIPVEVHSNECMILDDISEFKFFKIVFYSNNIKDSSKRDSFLRYANVFGMDIEVVDNLQSYYDIAIFINEEVDENFKNEILKSNKKYIALMSIQSNIYDKHNNISLIYFPLYCSKIKTSFTYLLTPDVITPDFDTPSLKYKGHILVAEDNEANQELIKILLSKYGLSFDLVENGFDALNKYKIGKYDLILMDEQMPIMDGNEAVKKIFEYEKTNNLKHTPVSALTANVIKGSKEKGLQNGYDAFLGKPIMLKELEDVFKKYLEIDKTKKLVISKQQNKSDNKLNGLDMKKLKRELMLDESELIMLIKLFIKKMKKTLIDLEEAIKLKDYKKISFLAHSIKGSSGNFRIKILQDNSFEMEQKAKVKDSSYDYNKTFELIKTKIQEINIS